MSVLEAWKKCLTESGTSEDAITSFDWSRMGVPSAASSKANSWRENSDTTDDDTDETLLEVCPFFLLFIHFLGNFFHREYRC